MINYHDILIGLVILGIIVFQIVILRSTIDKIKIFENVLKQSDKFVTRKVYVPLDEIDTINSSKILENISHYKKNPSLLKLKEYSSKIDVHEINIKEEKF